MLQVVMSGSVLLLQSDWNEALREHRGTAWVSFKIKGQVGIRGHIKKVGERNDGVPNVVATDGFRVDDITRHKITVTHIESSKSCTFHSPSNSFRNIHEKRIHSLDVTNGGLGVSCCSDGKLNVWETSKGEVLRCLKGHVGDIYTCRYFPSGVVILTGGMDMRLKIWSATTGECPVTLTGHTAAITDTAIVDKGKNVVSTAKDGTALLWSCGQSSCLGAVCKEVGVINCCDLQSNAQFSCSNTTQEEYEVGTSDKILLIGTENKIVKCFGVMSRQKVCEWTCSDAVNAVCFLNSDVTACGTQDGNLYFWDIRNPLQPLQLIQDSQSPITSLSRYSGGIWVGKQDGSLSFYKIDEPSSLLSLSGPDCEPITSLSSAGHTFYSSSRDGVIRKYTLQ